MLEKLDLPYSVEAEKNLLGALLSNNNYLNEVNHFLKSNHFYDSLHTKIYDIIQSTINHGRIADPVSLSSALHGDEAFKIAGKEEYINELIRSYIEMISTPKEMGELIYELYVKRELISIGHEIVSGATRGKHDVTGKQQIEVAEEKLFELASSTEYKKSNFSKISSQLRIIRDNIKKVKHDNINISGLSTGFKDLDKKLGGMHSSDLLILASRPSMGKTALAVNIGYRVARSICDKNKSLDKKHGGVGLFSLEMSSEQIASRILSIVSGVNSFTIRTGRYDDKKKISDIDFSKIVDSIDDLEEIPFYIDDTPAISISSLRTRARRMKRLHDISLIVVDYLQLVRSDSHSNGANRVYEISEITQGLKAIAKELNIPVLALSQLSRMVESREDKKPQLSDLRESGSIEQDADVVMFIYREEYYLERLKPRDPKDPSNLDAADTKAMNEWLTKIYGKPKRDANNQIVYDVDGEQMLDGGVKNLAEIIIAKQRNGPVGVSTLFFDSEKTMFDDLT